LNEQLYIIDRNPVENFTGKRDFKEVAEDLQWREQPSGKDISILGTRKCP
jgi:hypothetical protein